jgi:NTP pyrophosphatase (non-canonical NTP hydrolase)
MDVKELQGQLAALAAEQGLDESPSSLAMALAAEAGAVLGMFRWTGEARSPALGSAADGLAEVVLHAVLLADRLGIDLEEALTRKLAESGVKQPASAPRAAGVQAAPEGRLGAKTQGLREELRQAAARLGTQRAAGTAATARASETDARSRAASTPSPRPPDARSPAAPPAPPAARASTPPARAVATPAPPARAAAPPAATRAAGVPPQSPPPRSTGAQPVAARASARPAAAPPPPPVAVPVSEPPPDRFASLDTGSAIGFLKSLSRRVDGARGDDPLLRELHDELQTLKRNLYSSTAKPAWIGASLETIRNMLEEAQRHAIGEEIRAAEHLVHVQNILNP